MSTKGFEDFDYLKIANWKEKYPPIVDETPKTVLSIKFSSSFFLFGIGILIKPAKLVSRLTLQERH